MATKKSGAQDLLKKRIAAQRVALRKQLLALNKDMAAYGKLVGGKSGPAAVLAAVKELKLLKSGTDPNAVAISLLAVMDLLRPLESKVDKQCLYDGIKTLLVALEPLDVDPIDSFNIPLVASVIAQLGALGLLDVDPIDSEHIVLGVSMAAALGMSANGMASRKAKSRSKRRK